MTEECAQGTVDMSLTEMQIKHWLQYSQLDRYGCVYLFQMLLSKASAIDLHQK